MKKLYILLTCALAGGVVTLQAQNPEKDDAHLDRTVVVENLYNPDIMNAHKINILPTLEEPQTVKKRIEYAIAAKPSRQFGFDPMDNFGATPQQATANNGYLRLGYGNRGNLDGRLSYRLDMSQRDELNANLQLRGMDGTIDLPEAINGRNKWNARTYRTYGSVNWIHRFNPVTLFVEADGENQVFNYMNFNPYTDNTHQHNIMGSLNASVRSNDSDADIRYSAGTGLLYAKQKYAFGYYDDSYSESYAETIVRSHAQVSGDVNERTNVYIAAQMDNIFAKAGGEYNDVNLTVLRLNPYLTCDGSEWNARIGMHVDPIFGNGGSQFAFAPDLYGEYRVSQGYAVYLSIGGGRELNDFRTINRFDPYAEYPVYHEGGKGEGFYAPRHTFTPLDAQIGFKATPLNELGVQLYGGYQRMQDKLFSISMYDYTYGHLCRLLQDDANRLYAGLSAQYAWKEFFTTHVEWEWNKWNSDLLDEYTTLTPAMVFRWSANVRPIHKLDVGVSYLFEQRVKDAAGKRPDAVNNLGLTATYSIYDWLSIYLQGDNLLNQKYYQYLMAPAQGFNALIGAVLEF